MSLYNWHPFFTAATAALAAANSVNGSISYSNGYCAVLIVVQRSGNVVPLIPLFNDAVANTPVIDVVISGVTVTEFKSAFACNPDNVSDVVKTK